MLERRSVNKINLLIIGAQKCGTTTLNQVLSEQPDIWMSKKIKEPGFFLPLRTLRHLHIKNNIDIIDKKDLYFNYMMPGYSGQQWIGEASTFYSTQEWGHTKFVKLIHKYNPSIRLIYIVRDPASRIISHYHHKKKKNPHLSFDHFLDTDSEVFAITRYGNRIKPYVNIFGAEQLLVLQFEKLLNDQNQIELSIGEFLNINFTYRGELPHLNKRASIGKDTDDNFIEKIKQASDWKTIQEESFKLVEDHPSIDINLWSSVQN